MEQSNPNAIDELNLAISQNKNTTNGENGIPARVYKVLNDVNKYKLLHYFNEIFQSGDIPGCCITTLILLIWKIGKAKTALPTYIPFAHTSVGCKIMEHGTYPWVDIRHIFNRRYFRFISNMDSIKVLNLFYTDIKKTKSEKEYFIVLKQDIHSAYEYIWM